MHSIDFSLVVQHTTFSSEAMEVDDGRHFRNEFDEALRPADWEAKLRRAVEAVTGTLLRTEHRKARLGKEGSPT